MAKPLLDIHCITEPYCEYPVALKVTMDDGSVQTYELKNKWEYKFGEVMLSLEKMKVGYQYNGPKKKKNRIRNGNCGHGKHEKKSTSAL